MAQLRNTVVQGSLRVTDTIFSTNLNLSSLTASYAVVTDGSKNLISRAITNNTSASAITANTNLITANTLAYWNGAYSGTSSRLTTLGTISTGVWNATAIGVGYGGTGTQTAPKQGGIIFGSSTSAYGCTNAGTSGQLLQSAGTGTPTWITATNSNTASTIVKRDASGNFSAGTITASLTGNVTGNCSGSSGSAGKVTIYANNTAFTDTATVSLNGISIRWYNTASSFSGQPTQYGFLVSLATDDASNEVHQIFATQSNGSLYHRGTNSSSHASPPEFMTILDSSNYTSYTVTKTGSGASGTWDISISGTANQAHSLWQRYDIAKGTKPTGSTLWLSNWFNYQTGTTFNEADRIGGGIYSWIATNGNSGLGLTAYQHSTSNINNARIEIISTQSATPYISVYGQLVIQPENSEHEGGQIQLVKGPSDSKQCYIDTATDLFRIHDGTTVQFNVNLSDGTTKTGILHAGKFTVNTAQSQEYQVVCLGGAGTIYLYSQAATTGNRGVYGQNSAGTYASIISVDQSNNVYLNGTAATSGKITIAGGIGATYYNVIGVPSYSASAQSVYVSSPVKVNNVGVTCAIWNDFAEYRESEIQEPGRVLVSNGKGQMILCNQRLVAGAKIISDTFGFSVGRSNIAKTPLGIVGRVLAYTYQDRNNYNVGDAVCAAPDGTIDIMTREEIIQYPDRIIGIVDEIPDYEIWNPTFTNKDSNGNENDCHTTEILVNGRIWIYVK